MAVALQISDLTVHYETRGSSRTVLRRLALLIPPGEAVGIYGDSGSGKTTLARAIPRLLPATAKAVARIEYGGADLLRHSTEQMRRVRGGQISYIPQEPSIALNPVIHIGSQVAEVLRAHRSLDRVALGKEALALPARFFPRQAARIASSYSHQLSGGGPYTFTLRVTDGGTDERVRSMTITPPPPPAIAACPASSVPYGTPVSLPLPVTGYGPVSVSLLSGSLPPGLTLANNTVSGTPGAVGGPYTFTLLARDGVNPAQTVQRSCSVSIGPVPPVVLSSSISSLTPAQLKSYCEQTSGIVQINWPLRISSGSATITKGCTIELMTGPVLLEMADVALAFNGALSIIGRGTSTMALSKTRLTANSAGIDLPGANSAILATESSVIASTGALSINVGHLSTIEWLKRHSSQSNSLSSAAVLSLTAGDKFSGSFTEARLRGVPGVSISLPGNESLFKAHSASTIEAPSGSISVHATGSKALIEVDQLTARFGQSLSMTASGAEGTLKLSKLSAPGPASGAVTLQAHGLVEATEVTLSNAASANVGSTNGSVKFFKGNVSVNGDIIFEGSAGTEVNENALHSPTRVRIASLSGSCVASSNSITAPVVQSCP